MKKKKKLVKKVLLKFLLSMGAANGFGAKAAIAMMSEAGVASENGHIDQQKFHPESTRITKEILPGITFSREKNMGGVLAFKPSPMQKTGFLLFESLKNGEILSIDQSKYPTIPPELHSDVLAKLQEQDGVGVGNARLLEKDWNILTRERKDLPEGVKISVPENVGQGTSMTFKFESNNTDTNLKFKSGDVTLTIDPNQYDVTDAESRSNLVAALKDAGYWNARLFGDEWKKISTTDAPETKKETTIEYQDNNQWMSIKGTLPTNTNRAIDFVFVKSSPNKDDPNMMNYVFNAKFKPTKDQKGFDGDEHDMTLTLTYNTTEAVLSASEVINDARQELKKALSQSGYTSVFMNSQRMSEEELLQHNNLKHTSIVETLKDLAQNNILHIESATAETIETKLKITREETEARLEEEKKAAILQESEKLAKAMNGTDMNDTEALHRINEQRIALENKHLEADKKLAQEQKAQKTLEEEARAKADETDTTLLPQIEKPLVNVGGLKDRTKAFEATFQKILPPSLTPTGKIKTPTSIETEQTSPEKPIKPAPKKIDLSKFEALSTPKGPQKSPGTHSFTIPAAGKLIDEANEIAFLSRQYIFNNAKTLRTEEGFQRFTKKTEALEGILDKSEPPKISDLKQSLEELKEEIGDRFSPTISTVNKIPMANIKAIYDNMLGSSSLDDYKSMYDTVIGNLDADYSVYEDPESRDMLYNITTEALGVNTSFAAKLLGQGKRFARILRNRGIMVPDNILDRDENNPLNSELMRESAYLMKKKIMDVHGNADPEKLLELLRQIKKEGYDGDGIDPRISEMYLMLSTETRGILSAEYVDDFAGWDADIKRFFQAQTEEDKAAKEKDI
jgi:hypothetical protein